MTSITEVPSVIAPMPEVIERLESILAMAKAGRVRSVAVVATLSNSETMNGWAGNHNPVGLVGELEVLKRELMDGQIDLRGKPAGEGYCE